mmetsp:Transcript_41216/g.68571  ORF Transcript_41216/g.68571 Transcript_41216/m.68571 type:complete len:206 (+) Transcript_41216:276-893(+)
MGGAASHETTGPLEEDTTKMVVSLQPKGKSLGVLLVSSTLHGTRIKSFVSGEEAERSKRLAVGDVITHINSQAVQGACQASDLIKAAITQQRGIDIALIRKAKIEVLLTKPSPGAVLGLTLTSRAGTCIVTAIEAGSLSALSGLITLGCEVRAINGSFECTTNALAACDALRRATQAVKLIIAHSSLQNEQLQAFTEAQTSDVRI